MYVCGYLQHTHEFGAAEHNQWGQRMCSMHLCGGMGCGLMHASMHAWR
jgi:hypothetical protein